MGAETQVDRVVRGAHDDHESPPPRGDMRSLRREHGWEPMEIEGRIPDGLRGTLHRVGPGLYDSFGREVAHSFEADGALCSVRLEGPARALAAKRVIESAEYREETRAGAPLYGSRATPWRRVMNGLLRRRKNTGNTALMRWQSRLFALVESSWPTEIDARDLSTIGETDLGVLGSSFTAHPHRVNAREAIYGFGMRWGPKNAIELAVLPDRGAPKMLGEIPLEHGVLLHDFAATEKHLVFLVPPMRFQLVKALLGIGGASDIFRWTPEDGVEVIVVPIDDPSAIVRFRVETFFQWHFAGAWEQDGEIVLHIARWPDFDSYEGLRASGQTGGKAYLHRVAIDPARKTFRSEPVWDAPCEFPEIDPRREGARHRTVFVTTTKGARRGVARVALERGADDVFLFERGACPSELVYVPRDATCAEGEGWGLTMVYEPSRDATCLAIFDAQRLSDGPVARCWMRDHAPMTFHGVWVEGSATR
ncbi:carotenoid oxygenase family protein [Sandaracinus amylolyticus]|nr:carotenoid oxygenase family protein [Sandaracinus amylolyticus]